jgi:peptidoglycan biosynthesis protein MviN/MurJ (putative lipid II flippase)
VAAVDVWAIKERLKKRVPNITLADIFIACGVMGVIIWVLQITTDNAAEAIQKCAEPCRLTGPTIYGIIPIFIVIVGMSIVLFFIRSEPWGWRPR